MTDTTENAPATLSRRDALKRTGLVAGAAGVVWAAPSLTTLGGSAFAVTGSAMSCGGPYVLRDSFTGTNNPADPFSFFSAADATQLGNGGTVDGNPQFQGVFGPYPEYHNLGFPLLEKNTGGDFTNGSFFAPAGAVLAHPASSSALQITFTAPAAGTYTLTGRLTDRDDGGGDGVTYSVTGPAAFTQSGTIPNGGAAPLTGTGLLAANDTVVLLIGPNGNYNNDSTQVDLTFTCA